MNDKPSPGAVILHVYSDKNKGDQGIVFSSIDLLEERGYDVRLLSIYHSEDIRFKEDHQQFTKEGYNPFPAIFPEPHIRRSNGPEEGSIIKKGFNFIYYLLKCQLVLFLFRCNPSWPKRIFRGREKESWKMIRGCRLAVVKGGSFFYGFRNLRTTFYYLRILYHLHFMKKIGLKVVIFPQSMGPWETWISSWFSRRIINRMDAVIVREKLSETVLKENRITRPPVYVLPDVVLTTGKSSGIKNIFPMSGRHNFAVNARPFRFDDLSHEERYIKSFLDVIMFLRDQGGHVFLIPQATGPTRDEDDLSFLRMIHGRLADHRNVFLVEENYNYRELIDIYSRMDLVVTTRLHAAIFAMSRCVPSVAVSYHGTKTKGLFQMMGLMKLVLDIHSISSEQLTGVVKYALDNRDNLKSTINDYLEISRVTYHRVLNDII